MIERKTVFILGAGASCPYGFPDGRGLREKICSSYVKDCEAYLRGKAYEGLIEVRLREAEEFRSKFDGSSIRSIDKFLALNPEFYELGRRAIIFRILEAEQESTFREQTKHKEQDWYSWLYYQLIDEIVKKEEYSRFHENDISFVTFNYDRSLEHILYGNLVNSFNGIETARIIEELNEIRIIHVFGQVAPLKWQDRIRGIEYGTEFVNVSVDDLSENLRIVYEENINPELEEARKLISEAKRIFFLGFGYAEENLKILITPKGADGQRFYGTALGLTKREIEDIQLQLSKFTGKRSVALNNIEDLDCVALLKKYL